MKMVSTTRPITTKRNTEVAKRCMWMRDRSCPLKRSKVCSMHHVFRRISDLLINESILGTVFW